MNFFPKMEDWQLTVSIFGANLCQLWNCQMTTSAALKRQSWRAVKAKIVIRFGTITAAAQHLGCSDEAIRQSVHGKCPRVAARLNRVLGI
jgi:hypothetical protein